MSIACFSVFISPSLRQVGCCCLDGSNHKVHVSLQHERISGDPIVTT